MQKISEKYNNILFFNTIFIFLIFILACYLMYVPPLEDTVININPDSIEYSIGAYSLLKGIGYNLQINHQLYPPRYPMGLPLLIVPFYLLLGASLENAVYAIYFFSIMAIMLTYFVAKEVTGNKWAGYLSCLLLSLSPVYIHHSRLIMAEIPSLFFILLIFLLVLKSSKSHSFIFIGMLLAFTIYIAYSNILILIPMLILIHLIKDEFLFKKLLFIFVGFLFTIAPLLIYNYCEFGDFFRAGYHYWASGWHESPNTYRLCYALKPMKHYNYNTGNFIYYIKLILGFNSFFYPFYIPIIFLISSLFCLKKTGLPRSFLIFIIILFLVLFTAYSLYCYQSYRFFILVLPFIFIVVSLFVCDVFIYIKNRRAKRRYLYNIFLFLAMLLIFVNCAQNAIKEKRKFNINNQHVIKIVEWLDSFSEKNAIIISNINGAYLQLKLLKSTSRLQLPYSKNSGEYTYIIAPHKLPKKIDFSLEWDDWVIENGGRYIYSVFANNSVFLQRKLDQGFSVYMEGTYINKEHIKILAKNFKLRPVFTYDRFNIYKLGNNSED